MFSLHKTQVIIPVAVLACWSLVSTGAIFPLYPIQIQAHTEKERKKKEWDREGSENRDTETEQHISRDQDWQTSTDMTQREGWGVVSFEKKGKTASIITLFVSTIDWFSWINCEDGRKPKVPILVINTELVHHTSSGTIHHTQKDGMIAWLF